MNRIRIAQLSVNLLLWNCMIVLLASCHGPRCDGPRVSYGAARPIPIMSCGRADESHLVRFLLQTHPNANANEVSRIAQAYIREAGAEGVNHDVAFCQMCIETNYLRFGGDVQRWQNNFCGLGATGGGVPGASFTTVEMGVRAHIQHLKAYASAQPLRHPLVDPRFGRVRRGIAPNVADLTGKWATDPQYGTKIRRKLQSLARRL